MHYLGVIEVPGGGASRNNRTTEVPFDVWVWPCLVIQPDADGLCVELGIGDSTETDPTRGAVVPSANTGWIRLCTASLPGTVVAVYNPNGSPAKLRVWGSRGPG